MTDQVTYIAIGGSVTHYGLLEKGPVDQWDKIQKHLSEHWNGGDQYRLSAISGCLEKLSTSLLQVHRINDFHNREVLSNARNNIGKGQAYAALRGDVACADFESLLLQARAALDRVTWFVSKEFKQPCDSFRKLGNILKNFEEKSELARILQAVLKRVYPWGSGLLATMEGGESFRDFVAHKGATTEKMTNCFGLNFIDNQNVLLFDCELNGFPLFKTSVELVQYLSFAVLNTLAACINHKVLEFDDYKCNWEPKTIVFSEFAIHEPENSPLTEHSLTVVRHMHPTGFLLSTHNVNPKLFSHAVNFM